MSISIAARFRKFLPVVIDVETAGFNATTDALLELAAVPIIIKEGKLTRGEAISCHFEPFDGANIEPSALAFTGIKLDSPFRKQISESEKDGLKRLFKALSGVRRAEGCHKCILVGHNAHFDLGFLNAAIARNKLAKHSPFHAFSVLDTVSLAALAYGQTVLARAMAVAGIEFDNNAAHSALYDAQKTAELFCQIINATPMLIDLIASANDDDNTDDKV